MQQLFRFLIF